MKKEQREFGNTLLEGVCIRLTWHLHNPDITKPLTGYDVLVYVKVS